MLFKIVHRVLCAQSLGYLNEVVKWIQCVFETFTINIILGCRQLIDMIQLLDDNLWRWRWQINALCDLQKSVFLSHVCHWQLHYDGSVTRGWRICVGTRETMTFFNGKLWISLTLDGAQGTVHKGTGNPDIKYHCHSVNWWFELIWASVHMTTSDTHPRSVIPSCCALKHTL